jgi:hypothetical protein
MYLVLPLSLWRPRDAVSYLVPDRAWGTRSAFIVPKAEWLEATNVAD